MNRRAAMPIVVSMVLLVFLVKPFADMLWQYQAIDAFLLSIVLLLLAVGAIQSSVRYGVMDAAVIALMVLILSSYLRGASGLTIFIKMESALLLYFLGRVYFKITNDILQVLLASYGLVVLVNYSVMALGWGYQHWGAAYTFSGLYFFKTDLSSAATLAFTLFLYWGKHGILRLLILVASMGLVVLSNARAYYIAILLMLLIYILYRRGSRINLLVVLTAVGGGVVAIFFLNWFFSTGVFDRLGFIGIKFDRLSDLFDASNTQGRNVIWSELMHRIGESGFVGRLFGIDLVSDQVVVNGGTYGSHSLYVGMLFNVGLIGVAVFGAFEALMLARLSTLQQQLEGGYAFFVISLVAMFLVAGLSVHTLQYTSTSWLPMFFTGAAMSFCSEEKLPLDGRRGPRSCAFHGHVC